MVIASLPDDRWIETVGPVPGIDTVVWDPDGPTPSEDVEVVVSPYLKHRAMVKVLGEKPSVRLFQILNAGFDDVIDDLPSGVGLCNATGVHDSATAELALTLTLAVQRGLDEYIPNQASGTWGWRGFRPGLADKRVLLLGYGSIGHAIASRLLPFEVQLTAVASRAREGDQLVEQVHGIDELGTLAPQAEVVISVLPGGEATAGILGERLFSALPDGAAVVNVGRGSSFDTDAAVRHLGRLRFAMDVTNPEPLPSESPLWRAPGVVITPHVGGLADGFHRRSADLVRQQLTRIGAGEEPINRVAVG